MVLFDAYATREILAPAIEAELVHVWKQEVRRFAISNSEDLEAFLHATAVGLSFITGIEDALPALGARLNAERDRFRERRAILWLTAEHYRELAAIAPDLVSFACGPFERAALTVGVVPAAILEPELLELEHRFGLDTAEFLRRQRAGVASAVLDEETHRWNALARLLGRS